MHGPLNPADSRSPVCWPLSSPTNVISRPAALNRSANRKPAVTNTPMRTARWTGCVIRDYSKIQKFPTHVSIPWLVGMQPNETIRVPRNTIDERAAATSAMPSMAKTLSLREIRDLVEYLSTLKCNYQSFSDEFNSTHRIL